MAVSTLPLIPAFTNCSAPSTLTSKFVDRASVMVEIRLSSSMPALKSLIICSLVKGGVSSCATLVGAVLGGASFSFRAALLSGGFRGLPTDTLLLWASSSFVGNLLGLASAGDADPVAAVFVASMGCCSSLR